MDREEEDLEREILHLLIEQSRKFLKEAAQRELEYVRSLHPRDREDPASPTSDG